MEPVSGAGATAAAVWAASGAAWLTGRAEGPPLGVPPGLVELVESSHAALVEAVCSWGDATALRSLDAPALLGERAALAGWSRRGATSCGGATRLLPAADGWLAVNLARPDDLALVPAWLGVEVFPGDPADGPDIVAGAVARVVAARPTARLVEQAGLLGMAVGALGETPPGATPVRVATRRPGRAADRPPLVVDLSSLWAGPLATHLLGLAGATVVKVESAGRPDGLRRDPSGLFDLLNAGKQSVALDFSDPGDRAVLAAIVARADVVVEASRPRALAQFGIDAETLVGSSSRPFVWASLTGHGRAGPAAMRVGFGDDAAVAGGLVAWDREGPCFVADAVADPLSGLVAAAGIAAAWTSGDTSLLDIGMARAAAAAACATARPAPLAGPGVATPRARPVGRPASALGEHTARWRTLLGPA